VLDDNFLAVGGRGEFDTGVVVGVGDNNIGVLTGKRVRRSDGEGGTIDIKALGGRDAVNTTVGGGDDLHGKVGIIVGGIKSEVRGSTFHVTVGSGSYTPSGDAGLQGSENLLWERGEVGGWASGGFDSVGEIDISGRGFSRPGKGGVKSVNSVKVSIGDRDLKENKIVVVYHIRKIKGGAASNGKWSHGPHS